MTKHDTPQTALGRWIQDRRKGLRYPSGMPTCTVPEIGMPALAVVEQAPRAMPAGLRGRVGGVVYFVDCGEFTKIGFTQDLIAHRLAGIATHNPFPLTLWALVPGTTADERRWHLYCEDFRHANEWFRFDQDLRHTLRETIQECGGEVYA